jgi:hypothetical protein
MTECADCGAEVQYVEDGRVVVSPSRETGRFYCVGCSTAHPGRSFTPVEMPEAPVVDLSASQGGDPA